MTKGFFDTRKEQIEAKTEDFLLLLSKSGIELSETNIAALSDFAKSCAVVEAVAARSHALIVARKYHVQGNLIANEITESSVMQVLSYEE